MLRRTLQLQATPPPSPPSPASDFGAGIMITVLVLAIAVILSASFYLLLRFLRRHRHRHRSDSSSSLHELHHHHHQRPNSRRQVSPEEKNNPLIDALPLFTFDSLSSGGGRDSDCAVCLSKFEPKDLLRLLPICCHAFHAECIDTWLAGNQSCPLCRSPIFVSEADLVAKFSLLRQNSLSSSSLNSTSSRSFRVEIGNVSRRAPAANSGEIRRSYSIGDSFDYVLDDVVSEVPAGSFRMPAEFKVEPTAPPIEDLQENLAAEVGTRGGGWLKDYLSYSLSSSRTASFRSSGRWFFTGSSRRSTTAELPQNREPELDLEASQLSNEIGELFRWLSGV